MKKTLLLKTKTIKLSTFFAFCIFFHFGFSQQVIGEFPIMDGGLENQKAGNLSGQGSKQKDTPADKWSVSSTGGTTDELILDTPADARTGNFSAQVQLNNDKDNARLQSPSTVGDNLLVATTKYTIQFFYKSPEALEDKNLKPGIYLNNTSGGKTTNKKEVGSFAANTWIKAYGSVTTGADFNASNWSVVRIGGEKGVDKPLISFDDFVVYAGDFDDTAPDAATNGSLTNTGEKATISWTAPANGVDGGGYVVVRYATTPNDDNDLNENGIYNVGNTTTNGTDNLMGTVVYIGTETTFEEDYIEGSTYKIYTADKAFNYSNELVIAESTASVDELFSSKVSIYPNPASQFINITSNVDINKVEVYNILGKKVLSTLNFKGNLDVSSLSKGMYMLKLTSGNSVASKKLIVK